MASRPIDEKIVVMKLDHSDFKRKASETAGLMTKLTSSLNKIPGVNLGKTASELDSINASAKNVNMASMGEAVQGVSAKFTAMSVVAITALSNIVNRAVDAGIRIGKSLSTEQIMAGFQEYELKMGSIQTILANTAKHGTNLSDVSKSLGELNDYADKTIYNFGDMTRNIGLFTNAGLKLEESTSMIKGFSNMAAASGTNSQAAAGAAYQLSQGLSSGYLMTMDWMSLTNAGMGNDNMKNDLIAMAQAMGTLENSTEYTLKNWKETLSEDKWLTSDVMSAYLQTMAGDIDKAKLLTMGLSEEQAKLMLTNAQMGEDAATKVRTFTQLIDTLKEGIGSGWAVTMENIFGDFDEATVLFSGISDKIGDIVGKMSDARNTKIKGIADAGGFLNLFEGLGNITVPLGQIFRSVKMAFQMMFPPKSVDTIVKLTEKFRDFTEGLKIGPEGITQMSNIFQGFFAALSTGWEIIKAVGSALVQIIPKGIGGGFLDIIEYVAKMSTSFNRSVKAGNGLTAFIEGLGDTLGKIGGFLSDTGGSVRSFASSFQENLGTAIDWIKEKLAPVGKFLKETFGGFGGDDLLGGGALVGIILIVKKIMGVFDDIGDYGFGDMLDSIKETFSGIGDAINNFATGIKYVNLILIATAIGILAVSLKLMEGISTEDITKGLFSMAIALGVMMGAMAVMSKFNITGGIGVAMTLIALSTAVVIMSVALKRISDLDPKELGTGILGLVAITGALAGAMIAMSKWGGKLQVGSLQLLALAGAIYILVGAVEKMATIKSSSLLKSVGALTLIFAGLAGFLYVVDRTKFGPSSAIGIAIISGAIIVMVHAIERMAAIKSTSLLKSLGALGIILGALAGFLYVLDRTKFGMRSSLGVLAIAGAMIVMVEAIERINDIDIKGLSKGLGTIAALLVLIAGFSKLVSGGNLLIASIGLIAIAGAINLLIDPITTFSEMSWLELGKGIGAMAVALLALAGAAMLMSGGLLGAVGIAVMAGAMTLLIDPIERFSAMTWTEMLKGFVGLAGGLLLLAGAALLLTPAIVPMLGMGAALLIMGVAMLAAGAGMALFGAGLTALASMTAASVAAIVAAVTLLVMGLIELIPAVVDFVVKLGIALVDGLMLLVPSIVNGALYLIQQLLLALKKYLPDILQIGIDIVVMLLEGIGRWVPQLVQGGLDLIINFINGMSDAIADNGPVLISAVLNLLGEIIILFVEAGVQVIDALLGWIPGVKKVTSTIGETAEEYIRENFGADAAGKDKGKEFADGLESTKGSAKVSGTSVASASTLGASLVDMKPVGGMLGSDFASSLGLTASASESSGIRIANAGEDGASSVDMSSAGSNFGLGFANGMSSQESTVRNMAVSLARTASNGVKNWLGIQSPSRLAMGFGRFFGEGLAIGIDDKTDEVAKSSKNMAMTASDSVNRFLQAFEMPVEDNSLHFKAVIDYDSLDVNRFGSIKPLTVSPDTSFANSMVSGIKQARRVSTVDYQSQTPKVNEQIDNRKEKQPAVIQVVTPERREVARWLVDDISEFQDFKMATSRQF